MSSPRWGTGPTLTQTRPTLHAPVRSSVKTPAREDYWLLAAGCSDGELADPVLAIFWPNRHVARTAIVVGTEVELRSRWPACTLP